MKRKIGLCLAIVLLALGAYIVHYRHTQLLVQEALQPCDGVYSDRLHFHFSDGIPCYRNALRVDPGNNFLKITLANQLTYAGRFAEARPLYQKVAGVIGIYQSEARRKLAPGVMQQQMKEAIQSRQTLHDIQTMAVNHNHEEKLFLAQHAVVQDGTIVSMAEPYKTQWLQMREQHSKEEQALYSRL